MSLIEEKLSSYDEYKDRVKALESKGVTKDRVVFLFRQAEGNTQLHEVLEDVRKKPVVGTLIHILITKAEFADATCPYKNDPKFKVSFVDSFPGPHFISPRR